MLTIPPIVAGIARSHVDTDIPARGTGTGAHRAEDRARPDHDLTMLRVDRTDRVQTTQAQHHLAAAWNTSPDKACVATLGDDRRRPGRTRPQHAGDLVGAGRPHHTARRPAKTARPIGLVAGPQIGVDQDVRWPHDADERIDQGISDHGPLRTYQPEPRSRCRPPSRRRTLASCRSKGRSWRSAG